MTKLFQHNTLASLMAGVYEGSLTIDDLLKHGGFGLGTMNMIDGELIILDGHVYNAKGDKTVTEPDGSAQIPYGAVVNHNPLKETYVNELMQSSDIEKLVQSEFPSENVFYSIKMQGTFSKMHVRVIEKSTIGTKFVDAAANQPEFMEENISGTVVGIWSPELFHGVSVAGFHLHFISDDKKFGGHIMDFEASKISIEIGMIDELVQNFSVQDQHFMKTDIDVSTILGDIEKSE